MYNCKWPETLLSRKFNKNIGWQKKGSIFGCRVLWFILGDTHVLNYLPLFHVYSQFFSTTYSCEYIRLCHRIAYLSGVGAIWASHLCMEVLMTEYFLLFASRWQLSVYIIRDPLCCTCDASDQPNKFTFCRNVSTQMLTNYGTIIMRLTDIAPYFSLWLHPKGSLEGSYAVINDLLFIRFLCIKDHPYTFINLYRRRNPAKIKISMPPVYN